MYWLEESAKQDNTDAQCLLGKVLLRGEVTDQDADRAVELLKKAIENGSAYAAYLLGKEYLDGAVLLQDVPEALRLLTLSADKGFTPAEYLLGKLLYNGEAIPQDISKALAYLGPTHRKMIMQNICSASCISMAKMYSRTMRKRSAG